MLTRINEFEWPGFKEEQKKSSAQGEVSPSPSSSSSQSNSPHIQAHVTFFLKKKIRYFSSLPILISHLISIHPSTLILVKLNGKEEWRREGAAFTFPSISPIIHVLAEGSGGREEEKWFNFIQRKSKSCFSQSYYSFKEWKTQFSFYILRMHFTVTFRPTAEISIRSNVPLSPTVYIRPYSISRSRRSLNLHFELGLKYAAKSKDLLSDWPQKHSKAEY